jgi:hypothetical protein
MSSWSGRSGVTETANPTEATPSVHFAGYRAPDRGDFQKAVSRRSTSFQGMERGTPLAGTKVPEENAVALPPRSRIR